jgi:hypothetical protein
MRVNVYLKTMSEGKNHPDARYPTIHCLRSGARVDHILSPSITNSRLVVIAKSWESGGFVMIIWDWKSSQVLFVRRFVLHMVLQTAQAITQELEYGRCESAEFIDDYRLLIILKLWANGRPSLVLIDTGNDIGGTPIQTTFHFPPQLSHSVSLSLILERGMHKPSPAESLAPFHQDPAQRIIVLYIRHDQLYLTLRVGALLELFKDHEGTKMEWDEWKDRVVIPSSPRGTWTPDAVRISGCRLIYFWSTAGGSGYEMEVFDSSMQGRAKCSRKWTNGWLGTKTYLPPAGGRVRIPLEGFLGLYTPNSSAGGVCVYGSSVDRLYRESWLPGDPTDQPSDLFHLFSGRE